MAKFNVVQKQRRAAIAEQKRAKLGDPLTRKLKHKDKSSRSLSISISGKRKRKLFKKWRRDQKAALENGLITIHDVQMAIADPDRGTSKCNANKEKHQQQPSNRFHIKKSSKLKLRQLSTKKDKNRRKSDKQAAAAAALASTDAMQE